jgi:copper(I)-binding protein
MSLRLLTASLIALQTIGVWAPSAVAGPAAAATVALTVSGGHVAEAPPGAKVMAAFMTLRNAGRKPQTITGLTSPDFGRVELHETRRQGDMAKMEVLPRLAIPAGGSVTLTHGGKHVMLFGPKRPLKAGDTVTLTFRLDGQTAQTIKLPVQAADGGHHGHDHGGHHH